MISINCGTTRSTMCPPRPSLIRCGSTSSGAYAPSGGDDFWCARLPSQLWDSLQRVPGYFVPRAPKNSLTLQLPSRPRQSLSQPHQPPSIRLPSAQRPSRPLHPGQWLSTLCHSKSFWLNFRTTELSRLKTNAAGSCSSPITKPVKHSPPRCRPTTNSKTVTDTRLIKIKSPAVVTTGLL